MTQEKYKIGTTFSIEKKIDQNRMDSWARISGDFNPLHVDPEYARNTAFKTTIAHGPMSLAFLNELMVKNFGKGWVVGGQLLDVRFVSPVRDGNTINICGVVERTFEEDGKSYIECDLYIMKDDGVKSVLGRGIARI